eukprot:12079057-Karenia_brevis.AAC.1
MERVVDFQCWSSLGRRRRTYGWRTYTIPARLQKQSVTSPCSFLTLRIRIPHPMPEKHSTEPKLADPALVAHVRRVKRAEMNSWEDMDSQKDFAPD